MTFLRRGQVVHHGYSSVGLKPVLVRRKSGSLVAHFHGSSSWTFDGTGLTSLSGLVGKLI